jgi:hypothetical protein
MVLRDLRSAAALSLVLALAGLPAPALAGAWVLPRGKSWVGVSLMFQDTTERYFLDRRRIPYFFEGRNRTTAAFFDYRRGLVDGLEASAQLPVYSLRFDDLADRRRSTGLGDLRLGLRYNVLKAPLVATVGAAIKFPTGDFVNDAEVIPVGEGQYDVEVTGELGRSLWPRPGYVTAQIGYRFRAANREVGIDPGDEVFGSLEGGYTVAGRMSLKGLVRALYGFDATSFGLPLASRRREIVYVQPGVSLRLGSAGGLELSTPISLRGRNYPAGIVFSLSFYTQF